MLARDQSFPRAARLLTAQDFKLVFDHNDHRASNRFALVLARRNSLNYSRLGLVVAKKNVKLAVQRNRVKRAVREFFRQHPLTVSSDLVLVARRGIADLDNSELHMELTRLWQKLERTRHCA